MDEHVFATIEHIAFMVDDLFEESGGRVVIDDCKLLFTGRDVLFDFEVCVVLEIEESFRKPIGI